MQAVPRGLLAEMLDTWQSRGWDVAALHSYRMEAGEGEGGGEGEGQGGDGFKPITSQDDLNRIIADRVNRERAKFADYKDLKGKADQFDQLQASHQSETEKLAQRIAEMEKANVDLQRSTLRSRIQAKHGISDEDAELFLTGGDEESLTKQAERLTAREADRKKSGNHVPREGHTPPPLAESDERAAARALFGGGN